MTTIAVYPCSDGRLEPRSDNILKWVRSQNPKTFIEMDIKKNLRSSRQNRYLNGWIYRVLAKKMLEAGINMSCGMLWTRESLHCFFQNVYLVLGEYEENGLKFKEYESTTKMNKKRFCEFINEEIRPCSREIWNIDIPEPQDGIYSELLKDIRYEK